MLLCALVGLLGLYFVHAAADGLSARRGAAADSLVTWDRFSLSVNGSRVFLQSGEFHYPRLPVPELWPVSVVVLCHRFTGYLLLFF